MIFNAQAAILKMNCCAKAVTKAQFFVQNAANRRLAKCFLRQVFSLAEQDGMPLILKTKK